MSKKLLASIVLLLLSSCGYQFSGSGNVLPDDVKKIYVDVVQNQTTVPQIGLLLTEELRSQFERYQIVTVVEREFEADAVLSTTIKSIRTQVRDVTGESDIELESQIVMSVESSLLRRNGQPLWKSTMEEAKDLPSTGSIVVQSSSSFATGGISGDTLGSLGSKEFLRGAQRQALEGMVETIASKIYFESVASDF